MGYGIRLCKCSYALAMVDKIHTAYASYFNKTGCSGEFYLEKFPFQISHYNPISREHK